MFSSWGARGVVINLHHLSKMKAPVEETESKNHSFPKGLLFKGHPRIFQNSFETFFLKQVAFSQTVDQLLLYCALLMLQYLCVAGMLSALRPPFPVKNISQPTHYSLLRLKEKKNHHSKTPCQHFWWRNKISY